MREARNHGVDDQDQQNDPCAEKAVTERSSYVLPAKPFVPHPVLLKIAGSDQTVVPAPAFVQHLGFRNATGEDHSIHREFLDPEMGVEEMDREDKSGREQRFVRMD